MCDKHLHDEMGDDHMSANLETPLRADAFELSAEEKVEKIEADFRKIMETLGLDLTDDSLKGTPKRVAKMFVKEIFGGLLPERKPHFLPIVGRAHVGYISKGKVIGLSKMNRIVEYYAKRPQVQERLTMQIVKAMQEALGTDDVACIIDAKHLCVNSRGIKDIESSTVTAEYGGAFKENEQLRKEFIAYIGMKTTFNV